MNDSALLRATSSKVRGNPFLTDSDRRDGQDVVGRAFIPGMAPAGGQAAVGGGRWDLRQGPLPPAGEDAGDDGRQPAAEGCGLAHGAWAAAVGGGVVGPESTAGATSSFGQAGWQRRGWTSGMFELYGKRARKRYKTFVATWRPAGGAIGWCWWTSRVGGWPSSALTCRRTWPRFSRLSPTSSRWKPPTAIASRSSEPASSRCGSCGPISVHSTRCLWTSFTLTKAWARRQGVDELVDRSEFRGPHDPKPPREPRGQASDALTGAACGGDSCGSTPRGERRRNPGRLRTAAQLGRTILKEPTKSGDAHIWLKCVLVVA